MVRRAATSSFVKSRHEQSLKVLARCFSQCWSCCRTCAQKALQQQFGPSPASRDLMADFAE